jgi:hypothetical protein
MVVLLRIPKIIFVESNQAMSNVVYSKECHLPHEHMVTLSQQGILQLGINNANAVDISSNKNLKPTKTTASAAFLLWSWVGFGILGYSIYLSFTDAWWYFIPGVVIWQIIWRANKKGNAQNLIDAALIDENFYTKISNLNGWIYQCTEEKIPHIKQKSTEAIALASRLLDLDYNQLTVDDCLKLFTTSGFRVIKAEFPIEIEFFDSVIEFNEQDLKNAVKKVLAPRIINGETVSSGYELVSID